MYFKNKPQILYNHKVNYPGLVKYFTIFLANLVLTFFWLLNLQI